MTERPQRPWASPHSFETRGDLSPRIQQAIQANVSHWMQNEPLVFETMGNVMDELAAAIERFPPMNSPHEGFAVLYEEVDELWDVVKAKGITKRRLREEATQVAAMAMRFLLDMRLWDGVPEE